MRPRPFVFVDQQLETLRIRCWAMLLLLFGVFLVVSPATGEEAPPTSSPGEQVTQVTETPSADDLRSWVASLDDIRFAEREKATDSLQAAGAPAVPHLGEALRGESLEAADRAVWVLEQFAASSDRPLQLAALEQLVEAERFPAARRRADALLTRFNEEYCRERFEELGGSFQLKRNRNNALGLVTSAVVVVDPETWKGSPDDLLILEKLRRLDDLRVAAAMVDDAIARRLAAINGLDQLELIQSQVTVPTVKRLKADHPNLRVILRSQSMLGISFQTTGSLVISRIEANTPAEQAGLLPGDVVQAFNGEEVDHFDLLTAHIAQYQPGEIVELAVLRGDETVTAQVELDSRDWINNHPN